MVMDEMDECTIGPWDCSDAVFGPGRSLSARLNVE
jgi:hypothetical protein